jgi:hypothetical protein
MKRSLWRGAVALLAIASFFAAASSASAAGTVFTQVITGFEEFDSGSCSGELVHFAGSYHEVVHYAVDESGNLVSFDVMTGESNFGTGIGAVTGDRYVRIYRQNSVGHFEYDPYTESVVGTYTTRVLHLGRDSAADGDMWIRSVVRFVATPEGYVRYLDHTETQCF